MKTFVNPDLEKGERRIREAITTKVNGKGRKKRTFNEHLIAISPEYRKNLCVAGAPDKGQQAKQPTHQQST